MLIIMMMTVDVHQKCEHFGLGLGLESCGLGLGLGHVTVGLDYIPGITLVCSVTFIVLLFSLCTRCKTLRLSVFNKELLQSQKFHNFSGEKPHLCEGESI